MTNALQCFARLIIVRDDPLSPAGGPSDGTADSIAARLPIPNQCGSHARVLLHPVGPSSDVLVVGSTLLAGGLALAPTTPAGYLATNRPGFVP